MSSTASLSGAQTPAASPESRPRSILRGSMVGMAHATTSSSRENSPGVSRQSSHARERPAPLASHAPLRPAVARQVSGDPSSCGPVVSGLGQRPQQPVASPLVQQHTIPRNIVGFQDWRLQRQGQSTPGVPR
jgi:hypothetical protein